MLEFLETWKIVAACVAAALAFADGVTTWKVISSGAGRERETWKGTGIVWLPAKLIDKMGLVPYLVATRLAVAGALVLEPAAGYPLAVLFGIVTAGNIKVLRRKQ